MKNGIHSPKARKTTKRRLAKEKLKNEKKLKNKSEEEIEVFVSHEIALEDLLVISYFIMESSNAVNSLFLISSLSLKCKFI